MAIEPSFSCSLHPVISLRAWQTFAPAASLGDGLALVFSRQPVELGHGAEIAAFQCVRFLVFQASVVHERSSARRCQSGIDTHADGGAQVFEFLGTGFELVKDLGRAVAETIGAYLARGDEYVRVKVTVVSAFVWRMKRHLCGNVVAVHQQLANVTGKLSPLLWVQLVWQGHQHFTRNACVLSCLVFFDFRPELMGICSPGWGTIWRKHVNGKNAGFLVVVVAGPAGVVQGQASPVGRGSCCAVALATAKTFHLD
ncbi:hypothetical protein A7X57_13980 [Stenotrophomonas maltophilia]|nr:hypothetical protein A7X57_13980 [Stenotrophomonas maltophilia]